MGWFDKSEKEQEPEEDIDTYELYIECKNCAEEEAYDIPFGTTQEEFIKGKKCECCGCLIMP